MDTEHMLDLRNITLININGVDPDIGVKALKYSSENITFGKMVLVSHIKPDNITDDIEFIESEKFDRKSIEMFYFKELNNIIDTEFMLSIQPDGFVIHAENWTDKFLEYDYIGAPWPALPWNRKNRVGNGGFVLISKKFLRHLPTLAIPPQRNNDGIVTNVYYQYFINNGCKYAPLELAARFSLEHPIPEVPYDLSKCFGYHGKLTDEAKKYSDIIKDYE